MTAGPVEILISNYNSYEAIQLCVESIRALTDYPGGFRIIVHDDESVNGVDVPYLEAAERRGWLRLVRGDNKARWRERKGSFPEHIHHACYWHGLALDRLINRECRSDIAVVMDCDVRVTSADWLSQLLTVMDGQTLIVADERGVERKHNGSYVLGWHKLALAMLNMTAYRDGMQVNWEAGSGDVRVEPFTTLCHTIRDDRLGQTDDHFMVVWDPGASLWMKMQLDNPKQYVSRPLPLGMEQRFTHPTQVSVRLGGAPDNPRTNAGEEFYDRTFVPIKRELKEIRAKYADRLK